MRLCKEIHFYIKLSATFNEESELNAPWFGGFSHTRESFSESTILANTRVVLQHITLQEFKVSYLRDEILCQEHLWHDWNGLSSRSMKGDGEQSK